MITCQRVTAAILLLAGCLAGCAVDDKWRSSEPGASSDGLIVSTAPLGMPREGKARLVLTQAFDDQQTLPVSIRFKDARGRELARREGVIGAGKPVIEELDRADIDVTGTVLLQTEIVFPSLCETSCPIHLSLEIIPRGDTGYGFRKAAIPDPVSGEGDSGSAYTCAGIDPYGGTDVAHGPGAGTGVFPLCAVRATSGGSANQ